MLPNPRLGIALWVAAIGVPVSGAATVHAQLEHPSVPRDAVDRVTEARLDRIEEPADAWTGLPEPKSNEIGGAPADVRPTPAPGHGAVAPARRSA